MSVTLPLHTDGLTIKDAADVDMMPFLQHGISKSGFESSLLATLRETDPQYFMDDMAYLKSLGGTWVRVALNAMGFSNNANGYQANIDAFLDACDANNLGYVLELHWWENGQLPDGAVDWNTAINYMHLATDWLAMLTAHYQDRPRFFGVEINEFRPKLSDVWSEVNLQTEYRFRFDLWSELADKVHAVNPNMLILNEIGNGGRGVQASHLTQETVDYCLAALEGHQNMVMAPHCYFVYDFGGRWDTWELYNTGQFDAAKASMDGVFDYFYAHQQQTYQVPAICTEWSGQGLYGPQIIADEWANFQRLGWGSAYWWFFRQRNWVTDPRAPPYDMGIFEGTQTTSDWRTLSPNGEMLTALWGGFTPDPEPDVEPEPDVNPGKQLLIVAAQQLHADITQAFYHDKTISLSEFESSHAACWTDLRQALLDNGYLVQQWDYTFQCDVTHPAIPDPFHLESTINSPIQLTAAMITNNIDLIKQADWSLKSKEIQYREA
jgi:hypothetical protein